MGGCPCIPPQKGEMIIPSCPCNFKKSVWLPIACNCKYLINRLCLFILLLLLKLKLIPPLLINLKFRKQIFIFN